MSDRPGGTSAFILIAREGLKRLRSKSVNLPISKGSRITINTGGGGGYGDPFEREPERVRADVLAGFVSVERAREAYGVVFSNAELGDSLQVDEQETLRLRAVR